MHRRICEYCGKEFETASSHGRFCSDRCQKGFAHHHMPESDYLASLGLTKVGDGIYERRCAYCGKVFQTRNTLQKHCSSACNKLMDKYGCNKAKHERKMEDRALALKMKVAARKHVCVFCGMPLQSISVNARFCSEKCKNSWKHYRMTKCEVESLRHKKCEYCGREFDAKTIKSRFCSKNCSNLYDVHNGPASDEYQLFARGLLKRICPICKNEFVPSTFKHVYCSNSCQIRAKSIMSNARSIGMSGSFPIDRDAYFDMIERKKKAEEELDREFEAVMQLSAEEKRKIMDGWSDEKRNRMRSFYLRSYGLSSGKMLGSFGKEHGIDNIEDEIRKLEYSVNSELEKRVWDEDNGGFDYA